MIDYTIREFRPETDILKPFDCGNSDLNGFLLETGTGSPAIFRGKLPKDCA